MIKITTTTKALAEKAEKVMSNEVLYNPNLNGVDYEIEVGDFDEIVTKVKDQYTGAALYNMIFRAEE
jgi:hypothetical protein